VPTKTHHTFYGIEDEVVSAIAQFIKTISKKPTVAHTLAERLASRVVSSHAQTARRIHMGIPVKSGKPDEKQPADTPKT